MMDLLSSGASRLGLPLSPAQLDQFESYRMLLLEWNRRFNLTSIDAPDEVETRHFLDSLSVLRVLRGETGFPDATSLLDVGSGAGFPGIPLKIAIPDLPVTLLEATAKKVGFLEHVVERLGFAHIRVLQGRAEERAHDAVLRESFATVVARAVAPLATLCELCLPFVRMEGLFVAMKKGDTAVEAQGASEALTALGGGIEGRIDIELPGLHDRRHLMCIRKTAPTPLRFPRRPGTPARRPL